MRRVSRQGEDCSKEEQDRRWNRTIIKAKRLKIFSDSRDRVPVG